jgi:hypothetical protein
VISAADRWLHHRATFFSLRDFPLGDPIDWHRDYSSDRVAPIKYSGLINTRVKDRVGDIKYIWELNRLQHLILLALAGAWTGKDKYWDEIETQLIAWNESNPFMMGVNWKSPLEAAMRLITWAQVTLISRGRVRWFHDASKTIYRHQYLIAKFYSKNSSANNHLIGEMTGLYIASVLWPYYRESPTWRALARRKLLAEIVRQVEPDGVSKERATEYQAYVIELFLLAGALGHLIGDSFPQEFWTRLARMLDFLSSISNRSGDLPMFGDGDSGQAAWLPDTTPERIQGLIGTSRYDETNPAKSNLRSTLLLWGQRRQEIPLRSGRLPNERLEAFAHGGFYILASDRGNEDEMIAVFDAGPLGFSPLNAHGHADALSFCFSYGGEEFLIDPGTFTYYSSEKWRSYFRGTGAHNTVRVDGQDQSVSVGTFLWQETADCWQESLEVTDDSVEVVGSHNGYCRLLDPVTHTRKLELVKKSRALIITDYLRCNSVHDIEVLFHFSEKCRICEIGTGCFEVVNGTKRIFMRIDSRLKVELYRGSEQPISGWISRSFGVKESSFTLVARTTIMESSHFQTEITAGQ